MIAAALLTTAFLFGGATLYSFGFAAFLFTALPASTAGPVIRQAFPHFYLFVLGTSLLATALLLPNDTLSAVIMGLIAITTVYARQGLMPAINRATDTGDKSRFKALHGFSVVITLAHIAAAGYVLVRLAALS
ncbi:MAG: DUF4149 domain-containing protein [Pseudomonadota bacterium]